MAPKATNTAVAQVVRVREVQEYEVEVMTGTSSREAAKLGRQRFLRMTADEQCANSIGVTARSFEVGDDEFDEDELAIEADN
jgi:hypothetical protein